MKYTIETEFKWDTRKVIIRIVPDHDMDKHEAERLLRELKIVLNKQ